jgi:hypothetical protein
MGIITKENLNLYVSRIKNYEEKCEKINDMLRKEAVLAKMSIREPKKKVIEEFFSREETIILNEIMQELIDGGFTVHITEETSSGKYLIIEWE